MSELPQASLLRAGANDREIRHQSLTLQKLDRLQEEIHALVGNESSQKCDRFIANDVRKKTEDVIVVRISNHGRGGAETAGNCLAYGDIRNVGKQCLFDPIVPTNFAA